MFLSTFNDNGIIFLFSDLKEYESGSPSLSTKTQDIVQMVGEFFSLSINFFFLSSSCD
jgi:hypothetical protein